MRKSWKTLSDKTKKLKNLKSLHKILIWNLKNLKRQKINLC